MAEFTMIESAKGRITWECSSCQASVRDRRNFESEVKQCPVCHADISAFNLLYDEEGNPYSFE